MPSLKEEDLRQLIQMGPTGGLFALAFGMNWLWFSISDFMALESPNSLRPECICDDTWASLYVPWDDGVVGEEGFELECLSRATLNKTPAMSHVVSILGFDMATGAL